jgi:hypothetical protein
MAESTKNSHFDNFSNLHWAFFWHSHQERSEEANDDGARLNEALTPCSIDQVVTGIEQVETQWV